MDFPFFLSSLFFFSIGSKFKDKEIILIFVPVIYLDHPRFLKSCRVTSIKSEYNLASKPLSSILSHSAKILPPKNILLRSGEGLRSRPLSPLKTFEIVEPEVEIIVRYLIFDRIYMQNSKV